MKREIWGNTDIWFGCLVVLFICALIACVFVFPDQPQTDAAVPAPTDGMTSYCLPGGMRVFERPFPAGGTQPLFSVVYTGTLRAGNPYRCPGE